MHSRSAARHGISRFELGVALGLLVAIATGITLLARPSLANEEMDLLQERSRQVLAAARTWRLNHEEGCPTIGRLVEDGDLSARVEREDPWGSTLRLRCQGDEFRVVSAGQDKRLNTSDDVLTPTR